MSVTCYHQVRVGIITQVLHTLEGFSVSDYAQVCLARPVGIEPTPFGTPVNSRAHYHSVTAEQNTLLILAGVPILEIGLRSFGDLPSCPLSHPYKFYCMTTNRTCFLGTAYIVHYQVATTGLSCNSCFGGRHVNRTRYFSVPEFCRLAPYHPGRRPISVFS
jgi:hypothetical protein